VQCVEIWCFNKFCVLASLRDGMHAEPQSRGVGFGSDVLRFGALIISASLRLCVIGYMWSRRIAEWDLGAICCDLGL